MNSQNTGTDDSTTVSVRGEAFVEVPPERATVHVVIDIDGAERNSVQRVATEARNTCISSARSLHDAAAGPITEWSASQLQAWSARPWNADGVQLPLVYHSRATLSATFSGLDAVGGWIDALSAHEGVSISGIDWDLTDGTRQELEERCQRDAVSQAVAKASVYAKALGLGDVRPVEIAEPGAFGTNEPGFGTVSRMSLASAAGPTEFAPEPVRIDVQVFARFRAAP
jgi:uncharacterized protein YggE